MPTKLKTAGLRLQWHITYECDQRCRHCYVFDSPGHETDSSFNLDWKASKQILNDLVATANRWSTFSVLALTGGDPLLHPDFFRLLEYAKKIGTASVVVMGNPFHLDRSTAKRLSKYINGFQISLDGMQQTHDRLRKNGSYAESVRALGLLRDTGIGTTISFTLSRINKPDLLEAMRLAADLNVDSFGFDLLTPTGRGKAFEQQLLAPAQVKDTFDEVHALEDALAARGYNRAHWGRGPNLWKLWLYERNELDLQLLEQANTRKEFSGGCLIGEPCLTLQANGNVVPCPRLSVSLGKMPENTISQILTSSAFLSGFRSEKNFKKCRTCPLVMVCRGCPANAFSLTGDPFSPDPYCWRDTRPEDSPVTENAPSRDASRTTSTPGRSRKAFYGFTFQEKQALQNRDFWLRNLIERDERPHILHALFEELFPLGVSLFHVTPIDGTTEEDKTRANEKLAKKSVMTIQISPANQKWFSEISTTPYYLLINGMGGISNLKDILAQIRLNTQKDLLSGIGLYMAAKDLTMDIVNILERYNIELMLDFDYRGTAAEHPALRSFGIDSTARKLLGKVIIAYNGRLTANIGGISSRYASFVSLFHREGFRSMNFAGFQGAITTSELGKLLRLLSNKFEERSFTDVTSITLAIRMLHLLQKQIPEPPTARFETRNVSSSLRDILFINANNPATAFLEQVLAFYLSIAKKDPEYLETICQTPRGLLQRSQELQSALKTPNPIFGSG